MDGVQPDMRGWPSDEAGLLQADVDPIADQHGTPRPMQPSAGARQGTRVSAEGLYSVEDGRVGRGKSERLSVCSSEGL